MRNGHNKVGLDGFQLGRAKCVWLVDLGRRGFVERAAILVFHRVTVS
jgi:hypothetical protein